MSNNIPFLWNSPVSGGGWYRRDVVDRRWSRFNTYAPVDSTDWTDVTLDFIDDEGRRVRPVLAPTDDAMNVVRGLPSLSPRAVDVLRRFLDPAGELIHLRMAGLERWLFRCMNVVDALDDAHSDVVENPDKWLRIRGVPVLRSEVSFPPVFVLDRVTPGHPIFVSSVFVDAVKSAGLSGFKFTSVPVSTKT